MTYPLAKRFTISAFSVGGDNPFSCHHALNHSSSIHGWIEKRWLAADLFWYTKIIQQERVELARSYSYLKIHITVTMSSSVFWRFIYLYSTQNVFSIDLGTPACEWQDPQSFLWVYLLFKCVQKVASNRIAELINRSTWSNFVCMGSRIGINHLSISSCIKCDVQ